MSLVRPVPLLRPEELGHVHMVGVGGAGMSVIARILLARGVPVSGCDARDSGVLDELREAGAAVRVGHDPAHTYDVDSLVASSAVRDTCPELVEARQRGVRVLPRASALASVMAGRRGIAVTGTHGKTTTASLLAAALQHCGADPSYLIGGIPSASRAAARHGGGELIVAEADESDGSFLLLSPHAGVVTNIEADHLDNYGTLEAIHDAFTRFLGRIAPDGFLVCCADDPGARALAARACEQGLEVCTYGESADADVRVEGLVLDGPGCRYQLIARGRRLGEVQLRVPGRVDAVNAAGALATGMRLGFGFDELREGVGSFTGVQRRFELKGEARGVRVVDSYAHHPTELAADLRTARALAEGGRVIAAFQPHLYSRTRHFAAEFGEALALADHVVVLDVYAAREEPESGVSGATVAGAVPLPAGRVRFQPDFDAAAGVLAELAEAGDVVLTLGAGDVTAIGPRLIEALGQRALPSEEPTAG